MRDFFLGVLSNWVADAIGTALVGGTMLAWIKKRHPSWISTMCWGLGGAIAILIGAGALRVVALPSPMSSGVTTDNIEAQVRKWLDKLGHSTTPVESTDKYFQFNVTSGDGSNFVIARPKGVFDQYLVMVGTVTIKESQLKLLSDGGVRKLMRYIQIEADRLKISVSMNSPPTRITVATRIPISPQLTEDIFVDHVADIEFSEHSVADIIALCIDERGCVVDDTIRK
jgi:hypothetical protein